MAEWRGDISCLCIGYLCSWESWAETETERDAIEAAHMRDKHPEWKEGD